MLIPHIKFQDPISNRSWLYPKRNRQMHACRGPNHKNFKALNPFTSSGLTHLSTLDASISNLSGICLLYPPANYVCRRVYCFHIVSPSFRACVHPSVTFWFFLNVLKRQWWKFIKLCRHIDIDKMYIYNKKLKARDQYFTGVIALCNS